MQEIIVAITIVGNTILCLLMLYRGWVGRLQWFTLMSAAAVLVDCLFFFIHGFDHALYAPLRVFVIYWLFPLFEIACAIEAAMVNLRWLEYLMLAQVALATTACFAHLHGDKWTVYYMEIFAVWFNIVGIIWCITKFTKEPNYARIP